MTPPVATYRLQLRNGVGFDAAMTLVPKLAGLGFSHLYLSPIFTAQSGSTHGYDVIDPTEIDPVLGGEDGYAALARAAHAAGIGIILDIVPNHMAFGVENPWLHDVLRHGEDSRYASYFDIDWSQPLVLPWLADPFEDMVRQDRIHLEGSEMVAGDLRVPIRAGTQGEDIRAVHQAQAWRLTHWIRARDSITHRRFFNITDLIGLRIEDTAVFDAVHEKLFDLLDRGLLDGIRVDHVDGLKDPGTYLAALRARVGKVPIWVEKILSGDEVMPDWPVEGSTGYEAARQIARVLTHPDGHARLQDAWEADTGAAADFHAAVKSAKHEVTRQELAAELHQLIDLAQAAAAAEHANIGDETAREAVIGLLVAMPRYRTYFTRRNAEPEDSALMQAAADDAATELWDRTSLDRIAAFIAAPQTPQAEALQGRFQQLTGALMAKSHEDTAAFRQTAYLAACEVGADPDAPVIDSAEMSAWCKGRAPLAMTLTSSHDTKRSEDARMRLVAMSHAPDAALALIADASHLPGAQAVAPAARWYAVQAALAIWQPEAPELTERLRDHLVKATREAKLVSNWSHPDTEAEQAICDFGDTLLDDWQMRRPEALTPLIGIGAGLSMIQVALKFLLPGVPDVYQSCLGEDLSLTDPDNRRPVDFDDWPDAGPKTGLNARKIALSKALLSLRRAHAVVLTEGETAWSHDAQRLSLERRLGKQSVTLKARSSAEDWELAIDLDGTSVYRGNGRSCDTA